MVAMTEATAKLFVLLANDRAFRAEGGQEHFKTHVRELLAAGADPHYPFKKRDTNMLAERLDDPRGDYARGAQSIQAVFPALHLLSDGDTPLGFVGRRTRLAVDHTNPLSRDPLNQLTLNAMFDSFCDVAQIQDAAKHNALCGGGVSRFSR